MIPWLDTHEAESPIKIVSAESFPQVYVCLGERRWTVSAAVHWVPELRRSLPHVLDNCKWCQYPATVKSWIPVQVCPLRQRAEIMNDSMLHKFPLALDASNGWARKIFEVPTSAAGMLKYVKEGMVFGACRGVGKFHKKVIFRVFDNILDGIYPPFDVRPFLVKSWGVHESQRNGESLEGKR